MKPNNQNYIKEVMKRLEKADIPELWAEDSYRALEDFLEKELKAYHEHLIGEVEKIIILYGQPECKNLNHPNKKYQHRFDEDCPVETEIKNLITKLQDKK